MSFPTRLDLFMAKVDVDPTGCWTWTGAKIKKGYGTFYDGTKVVRAHRWAYTQFVGPIPEGLVIDHTCHTADSACTGGDLCSHRSCVNPEHLQAITGKRNSQLRHGGFVSGEKVGTSKLTETEVREIRARLAAGEGRLAVARAFGVSRPQIRRIAVGESWRHVA